MRPSPAGGAAGSHQGARPSPARVTAGREGAALAHAAPSFFPRMIEYDLARLEQAIENLGSENGG